jgi:hypothetical protein
MKKIIVLWILGVLIVISAAILLGYKIVHGDFNLDTTTLAALAFTSSGALFVSVGALIKQYYGKAIDFVSNRIGYSLTAYDNINWDEFFILSDWINSLDKMVIKNNHTFKRNVGNGSMKIGYGDYCLYIDTLTICFISLVYHDSQCGPYDTIHIKIIGMKKQEYVREIESKLGVLQQTHKDDLRILTPSKKFWVTKKNGNTLAGDYFTKLAAYVDRWNMMTDYYKTYGITHKLGILLYGNPGTGKSTLAKALASYFSYTLYTLTPLELTQDVLDEIRSTSDPLIVLFDDIDCLVSGREVETNKSSSEEHTTSSKGVLQRLLNLLDGVNSPDNIIFIATTNYIDRLDPALTRAGRFDISLEVEELCKDDAIEMCHIFNVDPVKYLLQESFPINQSRLQAKILMDTVKEKIEGGK